MELAWERSKNEWLESNKLDASLKEQLLCLNEEQQKDAFYKYTEFGTGGMRGVMGVGTNRINIYTIRRATLGLVNYIDLMKLDKTRGVVIAYDSRNNSKLFAEEAARVLATNDINVYIFDTLQPTPVLSFAVRELSALYGIVVTASHNPAKYNGYKLYNNEGCQLIPEEVNPVIHLINKIDNIISKEFSKLEVLKDAKLISNVPVEIIDKYTRKVAQLVINKKMVQDSGSKLKITFTPLHGTSAIVLPKSLKQANFKDINIVKAQENPDPEFSTVSSPNPENHEALSMAIDQALVNGSDLVLATDPDSDRLGVAAINELGTLETFTGNQLASLILNYIIKNTDVRDKYLVTTIVSSEIGVNIARKAGIDVYKTLTGFKYIGDLTKISSLS